MTFCMTLFYSGPSFWWPITHFFRMSNIAPHSRNQFDKNKHFLRKDVVSGPPGEHFILKWSKTLQNHKSRHVVQIPCINNPYLSSVTALTSLLHTRQLTDDAPLFANMSPPHFQVLDTQVRDSLKSILRYSDMPTQEFFHAFGRSEATFAF